MPDHYESNYGKFGKFSMLNRPDKHKQSNISNRAIIICGPTASGKTEFAHNIALKNNAEIINADSMQIYKQLPIITASPKLSLKNELPYHLYNFQDVDNEFSAAKYVQKASHAIQQINKRGKLPIIVGGSGMYINMLINGYSSIPDIDENIRNNTRNLHKKLGSKEFFQELIKLDNKIGDILSPNDTQRMIRAYEVIKQTGKSILEFHSQENIKPLANFNFEILLMLPDRKTLYEKCNKRLVKLFDNGAIEEVRNMYEHYGEINTSAMKALAVSEIITYIKGDITKDLAIELASKRTRQYAKRQITWFKNKIPNAKMI